MALGSFLVQWVSANVIFCTSSTAHVPQSWLIRRGLEAAAMMDVWRDGQWRGGPERALVLAIFCGGVIFASGVALLLGRWLLLRKAPRCIPGTGWDSTKFALMGMPPWAFYWFWLTVASIHFWISIELFYFLLIGPPILFMCLSGYLVYRATLAVCSPAGGNPREPVE